MRSPRESPLPNNEDADLASASPNPQNSSKISQATRAQPQQLRPPSVAKAL